MPCSCAVSFQLCHMPSGRTPKQTLHPLVFALDDDLHFPQQKKRTKTKKIKKNKTIWDSASAAVSNLKSMAISDIKERTCLKVMSLHLLF